MIISVSGDGSFFLALDAPFGWPLGGSRVRRSAVALPPAVILAVVLDLLERALMTGPSSGSGVKGCSASARNLAGAAGRGAFFSGMVSGPPFYSAERRVLSKI